MAEEFTPIESQEEFDSRISKRIERAQNAVRKEYEGFDEYKAKAEKYDTDIDGYKNQITTLNQQIEEQKAQLTEKDTRLQQYETDSVKNRIAAEYGIPSAMASRLNGTDEKSIRKDAESMSGFFRSPYPKKESAASDIGGRNSALLDMFNNLKG